MPIKEFNYDRMLLELELSRDEVLFPLHCFHCLHYIYSILIQNTGSIYYRYSTFLKFIFHQNNSQFINNYYLNFFSIKCLHCKFEHLVILMPSSRLFYNCRLPLPVVYRPLYSTRLRLLWFHSRSGSQASHGPDTTVQEH